ncbi:MAG: flagellar hook-associated protein FlgK, partial [Clostridiales bacterium]|nr:flagellar hook-associated protein FlgK [Clostridiales bacterium]
MGSTFFGLNIGKTGLYAYQGALDTTAHNIANGETNGYSRQVLAMKAGNALRVNSAYGMAGTGVDVLGVNQMRDEYYDVKFRNNNTIFGEYASKSHYMTELENYFNEISVEGFTSAYGALNESLQELTKNPSSLTVRTQVTNYAESLTEYFQSVAQNLISTQEECNFEIGNTVDRINSFGQQIASLTKQINSLEIRGGTANDLRDQRALLVDELSELVSVNVIENRAKEMDELTTYYVKIDNQTLVDGITSNKLVAAPREQKVNQNDAKGLYDIKWQNGQNFNANSLTLGGSLKALFEVRDGNNGENFRGKVAPADGVSEEDVNYVTISAANISAIEKLNIAPEGILTIHNKAYNYTGFEAKVNDDGEIYSYTFELEEFIDADDLDQLEGLSAYIGKDIKYKG